MQQKYCILITIKYVGNKFFIKQTEKAIFTVVLHSEPASNNGDSGTASEDQQSQIDFLNSIIVDQQTKTEELESKIKELESMLVNGDDIDRSQLALEMDQDL